MRFAGRKVNKMAGGVRLRPMKSRGLQKSSRKSCKCGMLSKWEWVQVVHSGTSSRLVSCSKTERPAKRPKSGARATLQTSVPTKILSLELWLKVRKIRSFLWNKTRQSRQWRWRWDSSSSRKTSRKSSQRSSSTLDALKQLKTTVWLYLQAKLPKFRSSSPTRPSSAADS